MELSIVLSSLILAFVLLVPLALKWGIKIRFALLGALLFGSVTGVILSWDWLRGDVSFLWLLPVELVSIIILTTMAVAFLFYRDPERIPPARDGIIVSPADGEVIYIRELSNGEVPLAEKGDRKFRLAEMSKTPLVQNGGYLVGIRMNLLNVHVNRAPIDGRVVLSKHLKGSFFSLKRPEALLSNERAITVIENNNFEVCIVQIASRLVRRIVSYLREGQSVVLGQRIGMIRFGSQVDVLIPRVSGLRVVVKLGGEVLAGKSVIAEYGQGVDGRIIQKGGAK